MPFSVVEHPRMGGILVFGAQVAAALAVAAGGLWLQQVTLERTPSPNCDEPTEADLECAVRRDWRLQVRARTEGPGVVYAAGCRLGPPSRWGELEIFQQAQYEMFDVDVSRIQDQQADSRSTIVGRGGHRLSFRDTWTWTTKGWSNTRCDWIVGPPTRWETFYERALRGTQIQIQFADMERIRSLIDAFPAQPPPPPSGRGW